MIKKTTLIDKTKTFHYREDYPDPPSCPDSYDYTESTPATSPTDSTSVVLQRHTDSDHGRCESEVSESDFLNSPYDPAIHMEPSDD